jgi:hypothetical protein
MITMKNRIVLYISFVAVNLIFFSCGSMNDIHEEYIQDRAATYASRPYQIEVQPGNGRLNVKMYFVNGSNIRKNIIVWNDGLDSIVTETALNIPIDSIEVEINNLQEKSYIFDVYNLDKDQNRSIKVQSIGSVYGAKYQSKLLNRAINTVVKTDSTLNINWISPKEGDNGVKLEFNDANGNPVTLRVGANELTTYIESWQPGGALYYSTYYLPAVNAIDEFQSVTESKIMP